MIHCPTLVIAGTHSGAGKTSFTLALARALARRGLKVQTFKVGPDFLDPTYLALASGRPCYNLDGWMAGHDHCRRLFVRATADADCALVEGVMGLFDGADTESAEGSTAEIARLLDAPVILIANVHGMGRSFAALVKGYTTFEAGLHFAGIVANHCGSERHAAWLSDSLQGAGKPPLLGAIPRGAFPELASRHLGLVTADERRLPESLLDALADALERNLSLETLFPKMLTTTTKATAPLDPGKRRNAPDSHQMETFEKSPRIVIPAKAGIQKILKELDYCACPGPRSGIRRNDDLPVSGKIQRPPQMTLFPEPDAAERSEPAATIAEQKVAGAPARLRIGVARDAAFHFYYQDLFDALDAAGCEVVFFSPLADRRLPEGISGLYLGGGYPELHAERLVANGEMLAAIRNYATSGRPLYAECGGLMVLSRGIEADGRFYPLTGVLPARTRMLAAKKALGYVEVALTEDSLWGRRGDVLRGHEFHYSELIDDPASDPLWRKVYSVRRRRTDVVETEGYQNGAILASYTHLNFASRPAAVARFLERCGGT